MAGLQVEKFALEIETCLKEFESAIKKALATYQETTGTVKAMTKDEEKEFLKQAFSFLYKKADAKFDFSDLTDAGVLMAIPLGVEQLFKMQEK